MGEQHLLDVEEPKGPRQLLLDVERQSQLRKDSGKRDSYIGELLRQVRADRLQSCQDHHGSGNRDRHRHGNL